jgi:hypothetical protein
LTTAGSTVDDNLTQRDFNEVGARDFDEITHRNLVLTSDRSLAALDRLSIFSINNFNSERLPTIEL